MEFIGALALVMLTLVGYSSGCILGGRGRKIAPGLLDPLIVTILWAAVLVQRGNWGKWLAILIGLLAGMIVGLVVSFLRRNSWPASAGSAPTVSGPVAPRMWSWWKAFAVSIGDFQGRILLIFFYFVVVTPFALLVRTLNDPLQLSRNGRRPLWVERAVTRPGLEDARRQF